MFFKKINNKKGFVFEEFIPSILIIAAVLFILVPNFCSIDTTKSGVKVTIKREKLKTKTPIIQEKLPITKKEVIKEKIIPPLEKTKVKKPKGEMIKL